MMCLCSLVLAWGVRVAHSIHQRELLRHHSRVKAQKIRGIFMEPVLFQQSKGTASLIDHYTHIISIIIIVTFHTTEQQSLTNRPGGIPVEVCGGIGSGDYRPVAPDQTRGS